jgi:hypothetical protein
MLLVSSAAILVGWGACPEGTTDLSHDRSIRGRPIGTVELFPRGRGIATGYTGGALIQSSLRDDGRRVVAGLKSRRPYGTGAFQTGGRSAETSARLRRGLRQAQAPYGEPVEPQSNARSSRSRRSRTGDLALAGKRWSRGNACIGCRRELCPKIEMHPADRGALTRKLAS